MSTCARRWDLGAAGKLTGELNYTHIIEYDYGYRGTTFHLAGTHGPYEHLRRHRQSERSRGRYAHLGQGARSLRRCR